MEDTLEIAIEITTVTGTEITDTEAQVIAIVQRARTS